MLDYPAIGKGIGDLAAGLLAVILVQLRLWGPGIADVMEQMDFVCLVVDYGEGDHYRFSSVTQERTIVYLSNI